MKHPVLDRILILLCAAAAFAGAAGIVLLLFGYLSMDRVIAFLGRVDVNSWLQRCGLIICALLLFILGILLVGITLPGKRKRSSNYAIQHNENGMVRISVKALEALVQKVLDEHAELKVVTSSTYSDEESVKVDLHVTMQSDISMPLAISALQKQIKKYIESCSGVMVQEVRVYVDNTTPATSEAANSPYAIPAVLLGKDQLPQPGQTQRETEQLTERSESVPAAGNAGESETVPTEEVPAGEEAAPAETSDEQRGTEQMTENESGDGTMEDAPLFSDVVVDADEQADRQD